MFCNKRFIGKKQETLRIIRKQENNKSSIAQIKKQKTDKSSIAKHSINPLIAAWIAYDSHHVRFALHKKALSINMFHTRNLN